MISVCIPTYEMYGHARELLSRNFNVLLRQKYKDFEIIISDNSKDGVVKKLCRSLEYKDLNIRYIRNHNMGASSNTNEAIKNAKGELIKILHMDDFLYDENSLSDIAQNFKGNWMVTGCQQEKAPWWRKKKHFPIYDNKICLGKNTIGSPSVLTIKNDNPLLFDENMTWVFDCDYYKRLFDKYGEPTILNKINVVIGIGKHQATHNLKNKTKKKEEQILKKRYRQTK